MKKLIAGYCWLPVLLLLACSPVTVKHTDAAPGFRLGGYKTFGFYEPEAGYAAREERYSPKFEYMKSAMIQQLESRGLRHSNTDPDLMVNLGIVVVEEVQTREADFMTDRPRYMGQQRYHWRSEEIEVGRFKSGTISVHLVDRERNEMVWQGEAEAVVPDKNQKMQKRLDKGVRELMAKVPQ